MILAAFSAWRRSLRNCRAVLPGWDTTPLRCTHTCRVTHTSRTPHVATTVLATLLSTIGKASQEPASVHRKAVTAWHSVSATMMTARTAEVRTASGRRRRTAGSSLHKESRRTASRRRRAKSASSAASSPYSSMLHCGSGVSQAAGSPAAVRSAVRLSSSIPRSTVLITQPTPHHSPNGPPPGGHERLSFSLPAPRRFSRPRGAAHARGTTRAPARFPPLQTKKYPRGFPPLAPD
ncbi:predicted protein [Streptomyces sp. SPB78]|uniref:hypothetical protein n=1 Tax=Streptomyces sp. (strain SPB78) TaxID=591157 RepID=UPI0001B5787C|nr:predicted protein [Streptomyces sp. SPB78]